MVQRARPIGLSFVLRNIGFLLTDGLCASRKAENHLNEAIKHAQEIGAVGMLGQANLELGLLYRATRRLKQARGCILRSIELFEACGTSGYLDAAQRALKDLGT